MTALSDAVTRLRPGDHFVTAAMDITEELRADVVKLGGFTHPLFARPDEVRLSQGSPLPGQAVLLLLGGLVERSDRLHDALVLVGMREVRFRRPVVVGTRMRVGVEVISETAGSPGRALREMLWTALDSAGAEMIRAIVSMQVLA